MNQWPQSTELPVRRIVIITRKRHLKRVPFLLLNALILSVEMPSKSVVFDSKFDSKFDSSLTAVGAFSDQY